MPFQLGVDGLGPNLSIGEIKQVHPATYTASVYIRAGERRGVLVECQIRALSKNDQSRTGVIFMPDYGDLVYVDWRFGMTPMITDHALEVSRTPTNSAYKTSLSPVKSFGGEDKFHAATGKKSYRWGPADVMPGDKKIMGRAGNFLGVLAGGLTILRGGKLSQIILSKLGDAVKIVARNFELFTSFGVLRMVNDKGVTAFELFGNSSEKKSNAHHESGWDYGFKIGGDNLFDLSLKNLFRFRVDTDGAAFFKAKTVVIDLESQPTINIRGDSRTTVDGHRSSTVTGDDWKTINGTKTERMTRHAYVNSGARSEVVSGPHVGSYLGSHKEQVRGTSLLSVNTIGKETRVAAGDYAISIGNPLDLGVPAPLLAAQLKTGDFKLKTFSGDITLDAVVKGNVTLNTLLGDVSLFSVAGKASMKVGVGSVDIGCLTSGKIDIKTLLGKINLSTNAGQIDIKNTLGKINIEATAGSITLTAGTCSLTLGIGGISLKNGPLDMMALIDQVLTQLGTGTFTPGYGAPIANAAAFTALGVQWKTLTGKTS